MDSEKDTFNIESIIRSENLPESVVHALKEADIDQNGELSLEEIVLVLQAGDKAKQERQMFKWLCFGCILAFLVIIGTMGGAIYGLVELTNNVQSSDGVLVSKSNDPLATGSLLSVEAADQLYNQPPESVMGTTSIALSYEDGSILYQHVSGIEVIPGTRAEITTTSGDAYIITADGIAKKEENPGGVTPRFSIFNQTFWDAFVVRDKIALPEPLYWDIGSIDPVNILDPIP